MVRLAVDFMLHRVGYFLKPQTDTLSGYFSDDVGFNINDRTDSGSLSIGNVLDVILYPLELLLLRRLIKHRLLSSPDKVILFTFNY